ncbi:hypothetical protein [Palleronia aestuarii]|uniref:hypothetical protein n=1 Tax=Palleronia aestuarii TaxID=568105 RepID=UPI0014745319|nr:hypothetical protein [Palleronia aestuarii]
MSIRDLAVLVVEGEPLIAMDIVVTLESAGVCILGPVRSLEDAKRFFNEAFTDPPCDGVVLNYRPVVGTSGELALKLVAAGIPVILHTASSQAVKFLYDELGVSVVPKPALKGDLDRRKEASRDGRTGGVVAPHSALGG